MKNANHKIAGRRGSLTSPLMAALLLLALPVIIFWRSGLFYIIDDWTTLIHMVQYPFGTYLVTPDGEQWFPFFSLVYYGLVRLAGEHYSFLVLVNCLGTGASAFLVYLFYRRHLAAGPALTLAAVYATAAVHHAIAWNAFYVGYLLSLTFFLGALLLTDAYLRAGGRGLLGGVGLCALLSVLSHNYPLLGLLALPLYALLVRGDSGRKFWALAGTVAAVYLVFAAGYLTFAGLHAAASHNARVFGGLPGPGYLLHLVYAAWLAPFFYLFWGHYHFPVWAYAAGVALLTATLTGIWGWGGAPGAPPGPLDPAGQCPALSLGFLDPLSNFGKSGLCGPLRHLYPRRGASPGGTGLARACGTTAPQGLAAPVAPGPPGPHGGWTIAGPPPLDREIPGDDPGGPSLLLCPEPGDRLGPAAPGGLPEVLSRRLPGHHPEPGTGRSALPERPGQDP